MKDCSDIGEQLQKAREKRELSLKDVAHETRIPLSTLQALEKNDYSGFSSPTYTKSFLDQYSDYLKIDAHEVLENFNTSNVLDQPDSIEYLDQGTASTKAAPKRLSPAASSQGAPSNISQPLLILLITGCLIAGGVWGFITVEKRLNAPSEVTSDTTPDSESTNSASPNPDPEQNPNEEPLIASAPNLKEGDRPARVISSGNPTTAASNQSTNMEEDLEGPVYVFPEHTTAPRAIIVNEDEDQE